MRKQNLPRSSCFAFIALALLFVHVPPVRAASLVNGGVVSGAISVPGEQDSHTFTANVGESVHLHAAYTGSVTALAPWLLLYSPNGALIGSGSGRPVAALNACPTCSYKLPQSGTYTVVVWTAINIKVKPAPTICILFVPPERMRVAH